MITKEKKTAIINEYATKEGDTGSPEVQVAILTARINELNEHLQAFLLAYNHAKRLKTLRGLTPHEFVCAQWQKNPTIFTRDPTHLTLGLYN